MAKTRTPPYRFPVTTVIVDDDTDFLNNFALELGDDLAYRLFDSPGQALGFLEDRRASLPPLYQRCFSPHRDAVGWPMRDHYLRLDVSSLERESLNPNRFGEVGVILVDYAMPEMDGLAFCERIADEQVKKILFTGVGDEKVAVQAFNDGLIDRYLRKHETGVIEQVNRTIRELQSQYFRDVGDLIHQSLRKGEAEFLEDAAFARYFDELCEARGIVEYYFVAEPNGFLMLDADGNPGRLVVLTDEDMQAHWEIASDQECPPALAEAISRRSIVPYFWRTGGYYRPECVDWEDFVYPAQAIDGRQRYYAAYVDAPQAYGDMPGAIHSHAAYLAELDAANALRKR
ncbi:response regulator [Ectothiorhodospiraceae bacterium WFHF3C12]|nr:response regulator [Ectothiorhodospiraceae bacterium WFHF3C12]